MKGGSGGGRLKEEPEREQERAADGVATFVRTPGMGRSRGCETLTRSATKAGLDAAGYRIAETGGNASASSSSG